MIRSQQFLFVFIKSLHTIEQKKIAFSGSIELSLLGILS